MTSGKLNEVNKGTDGKVDWQTEADRKAQYCIVESLKAKFGNKIKIIGEEGDTTEAPIETAFSDDVLQVDDKISNELRSISEEDIVIWVDPLDGTLEYTQAVQNPLLLQQVTVLIGIAHKGKAIAGVIHQPYYKEKGRTIWGIVGVGTFGIEVAEKSDTRVVVTTSSHMTRLNEFVLETLKKRALMDKFEQVGGAGYKVLRCLEGSAVYVYANNGCRKWDTAAPEAVLKAAGGNLTDVSGRSICYDSDVQKLNSGGVLATAHWVNHQDYVNAIPEDAKEALPETMKPQV